MKLDISADSSKGHVFKAIKEYLLTEGFNIVDSDESRPWGGFFVIDEKQSKKFIQLFLNDVKEAQETPSGKVSPKILIVENDKRLSWQYHHRRSEVWKVIYGDAGVVISDTNEETPLQIKSTGDVIVLKKGKRHRLIGLDKWGVIAEIWQHSDANEPSDEEDIVRVQDDFGR
jgi:mannose-6-phosphate isomerase-like protein (cupin superfamily)